MDLLDVILILWLTFGVIGMMFVAALFVAVVVGGAYDFARFVVDRAEQRRRASGLCAHCGYDLRCSPRRCPECGQFVRAALTPHFLRT